MVIDQPLIQRASTVVSEPRTTHVMVNATIAPEIPYGYSGYESSPVIAGQLMPQPMIAAFNAFSQKTPLSNTFSGCTENCTGYIQAGGLSAQCNTTTAPITYVLGTLGSADASKAVSPFFVNFTLNAAHDNVASTIAVNIAYTTQSNQTACSGIRTERSCSLTPATLKCPVMITGSVIQLGDVLNNGT